MRKSKYRGQKVSDGTWVYGSLSLDCNDKPFIRVAGYTEHNPHHCGLIIYADAEESSCRGNRIGSCCINVSPERMNKYKVPVEEELKLLRLLGFRIWNMKKKKLAEHQIEPSLFNK